MIEVVRTSRATEAEKEAAQALTAELKSSPIPDEELIDSLLLYCDRKCLGRFLFMLDMYKKIVNCHGVLMEFGCRWGQNLVIFSHLRSLFEPYNLSRRLVGFDTFSGFPSVDEKDGKHPVVIPGNYSTTPSFEERLQKIMESHQALSAIPNVPKFELVKGDVEQTLNAYLDRHPETIVALAYFDMDIYKPTKTCLEKIVKRMPRGAVVGFDELNCAPYPGETLAFDEELGIRNHELHRSPYSTYTSYVILG
jgi:hypothetical protein